MDKWNMNQLAERTDALAWSVLLMAAHLEQSGQLDGPRYCDDLRQRGGIQGSAGLAETENVLDWLAGMLDDARQSRAQRAENLGDRG